VLAIAQEIEQVNNANMTGQRADVAGRERGLHSYLNQMLGFSMLFGLIVAIAAVYRISTLERRSEEQRGRAELAETEMRTLSHQLVKVHEDERRNLSRELHDEVGQMLTGLRMEFGKAQKAQHQSDPSFATHMEECKQLIDDVIQTVRDLSMGLRPAMLDDFGLGAALEWQARDFFRRYSVPVNVTFEGDVDQVVEPHRTSVYRVVQEALTNCARHAQATQISITVRKAPNRLSLLIHDDGIGMNGAEQRPGSLGLLGMKERVRDLRGTVSLHSTKGAGTTIMIEMPIPAPEMEMHGAGAHS
jgi:signal transduction histidine kinase